MRHGLGHRVRAGALALAALVGLGPVLPGSTSAREIAEMSGEEIRLLQGRLTQAGCYKGPQDGRSSDALAKAKAACPDQEPVLRIETGMHVAPIRRIGVDARCRLLATASDDKTVRLWEMPSGRLLRTQRLPIGPGNGGNVFAVAVSPDAGLVAAGGWDPRHDTTGRMSLSLFEAGQGESLRRIGAFEDAILHLAFSPDGSRLAVALGGGAGVRVLDVASGREVMADRDFGGQSSYGLAFGPDGALYAVSYDGTLRRYAGPDLARSAKVATRGGKLPTSVAVESAGRRLAVGYYDSKAVDLYEAASLRHLAAADTADTQNGTLSTVAWLRDGRSFVAGGQYSIRQDDGWPSALRRFSSEGRRLGNDVAASDNTILDVQTCGADIAFGSGDPSFGLLRPDGTVRALGKPRIADMRDKLGDAFAVSSDGTRLRFGLGLSGVTPMLLDFARVTLTDAPQAPADLRPPATEGLPVKDWWNGTAPTFGGNAIPLAQYEKSRALAVRPDRAGFVLGTEWSLRAYDAKGQEQWKKLTPGAAFGVNLARGGDLVLVAYGDGTIRWHRGRDGQELLALFVDRPTRRFVAWTPSGYYMASPGAEDLIGWHVNRGWEQAPEFFPAGQMRERFSRPDIVQGVLDTLDEGEAVRRAARNRPVEAKPVAAALPPVLTLVSPSSGSRFSGESVEVAYEVRSPSGLPVDSVEVRLDGLPHQGRGLAPLDAAPGRRRLTVPLPPRDVVLTLTPRAGTLLGSPVRIDLTYAGVPVAEMRKPNLYALVIGVSDYEDPDLRLGYAAKDARDFARGLKGLERNGLYGRVTVREPLLDRAVIRDSVVEGLEWLEREVTDRDIGVIFIAGHGVTDEAQNYWFLPADATAKRLRSRGVSQDDLNRTLSKLAGKSLMFLDTCFAGRTTAMQVASRSPVDVNKMIGDFVTAGRAVTIFASAQGREIAQERSDWNNGAFTKAVLEGLFEGKADRSRSGAITPLKLHDYIVDRVKELTGGRQHPTWKPPVDVREFPIALSGR